MGGAAIVVLGIALKSCIALFRDPAKSAVWAAALVIAAMLPQSLGHVFVERSLKALRQDLWWMWTWVNVAEIPLAAICVPLQLWVLGENAYRIREGFACLLDLPSCPADSTGALPWWIAFIFCLVMNRMFAALVIS